MATLDELLSSLTALPSVISVNVKSRKTTQAGDLVTVQIEYVVNDVVYSEEAVVKVVQAQSGESAYWYGARPRILDITSSTAFTRKVASYLSSLKTSGSIISYVLDAVFESSGGAEATIYMLDQATQAIVKRRIVIYRDPATDSLTHKPLATSADVI